MKTYRLFLRLVATLSVVALSVACAKGEEPSQPAVEHNIALNVGEVSFNRDGSLRGKSNQIEITASDDWFVSDCPTWVTFSESEGAGIATVTVSVQPNASESDRTGEVTFTCGDVSDRLLVKQCGRIALSADVATLTFEASADSSTFNVSATEAWSVATTDEWITLESQSGSGNGSVEVKVVANPSADERTGSIVLSGLNANDVSISVRQQGDFMVVPDREGMNIKGLVVCDGAPVEGVVVSDGRQVVKTDARGRYYIASGKELGYVFMTVPSGYNAVSDALSPAFPEIHKALDSTSDVSVVERRDFKLDKIEGGNAEHTVIFMSDTHFCNQRRSLAKYTDLFRWQNYLLPDMQSEIEYLSATSKNIYCIHTGDLTFDYHWYSDVALTIPYYNLDNYYKLMKSFPLQIFHVIGNHDNDPAASGDMATQAPFCKIIAPDYYSFNFGNVHYVVLDNDVYPGRGEDTGGTTLAGEGVQVMQLEWLAADLKYVDATTQKVVVCMHAPLMSISSSFITSFNLSGGESKLLPLLKGYDVEVYSGHTHTHVDMRRQNVYEHNLCSVAGPGGWWNDCKKGNTGAAYDMNNDGTPTGYYVVRYNGTKNSWYFKSFWHTRDKQFALYDLNDAETVDKTYYGYLGGDAAADDVMVNVWDWGYDWQITATENGQSRTVVRSCMKDPILTTWNKVKVASASETRSYLWPVNTTHMFYVQCSIPQSTVEVRVTSPFGDVYTDSITRKLPQ